MNLDNIKRYSRISKSILVKKVLSKFTNRIINKLQRVRDTNTSTYSYDYISYFPLSKKKFNFYNIIGIELNDDKMEDYCNCVVNHNFKLLSDRLGNLYKVDNFNNIQTKFPKSLIPMTTKCYNLISDDYKLIDWQCDFNNNYNWPMEWSKSITYGNNNGSDIKVPWELGRLQHLPNLAYYYTLNNDNRLVKEIKNQLFDFMASNPPSFGVQWLSAMDVGIRLVNIILTIQTLRQVADLFNEKETNLIDSYLFDHYLFIKNNDEFSDGMRGNHYLSNICSILIYLSFIEETESKFTLLSKYVKILNREINYQFYKDGTNFESSTRYHIFTSQMILTIDIVLQSLYPNKYKLINLDSIMSFTSNLLEYDFPPQFGDNDSGFYWKIINNEKHTYKAIKKYIDSNYSIEYSEKYKDLGYIVKTLNEFDIHFKCGKLGQNGKGGHDHNDNLSYCLYYDKNPIVVDPGTYCYTSNFEKRNKYRSTSMHNVLFVDNCEQNNFQENIIDDMFWIDTDKSNPSLELDNKVIGTIEYCGKQLKRTINTNSNEITVTDIYNSEINKKVHIHFHPSVKIESVENNVYKLCTNESVIQLIIDIGKSSVKEYDFSPEYGVKHKAKRVVIDSNEMTITHRYKEI